VTGRIPPLVVAAVWATLASACAATGGGGSGSETPAPVPSSSIGPSPAWIAVYDIAADPQELAAERAQILAALGDALEGAVVISPSGCFEGLPRRIDGSAYVLALQQPERVYVQALAEQLDGHPRFLGAVTVACTD